MQTAAMGAMSGSPLARSLPLSAESELLPKEPPTAAETNLVPVEIIAAPERRAPRRRVERPGFIEIEFGCGARLCIRGEVVPKTLRQVIELLR